jgi:hypothetical protein
MTFTDTFEVIRSDLDDLRDMEVEFDTDSCLSILARVHAVMVRTFGGCADSTIAAWVEDHRAA